MRSRSAGRPDGSARTSYGSARFGDGTARCRGADDRARGEAHPGTGSRPDDRARGCCKTSHW